VTTTGVLLATTDVLLTTTGDHWRLLMIFLNITKGRAALPARR
jgi:hypothetical protein